MSWFKVLRGVTDTAALVEHVPSATLHELRWVKVLCYILTSNRYRLCDVKHNKVGFILQANSQLRNSCVTGKN